LCWIVIAGRCIVRLVSKTRMALGTTTAKDSNVT